MRRDTERLSDNVTQILDLAKIEDKKYEGEFVVYDLNDFVESWVSKCPHFFEQSEIVVLKVEGSDPRVRLDGRLFEMLLMNLVTNGINYNQSIDKKIEIQIQSFDKTVKLIVKDNGLGIPKKEIKQIFKKFYQVGKTSKGTGLGLYMVNHIVRIHKGNIKVECPTEVGSQFIVELPRVG